MRTPRWHALPLARACNGSTRVRLFIVDGGEALEAGSVARTHLAALARWTGALRIDPESVTLTVPADERNAFFAEANRWLHHAGLLIGWRSETYPVTALGDGRRLASIERTAARFWGTLTFGAHCNGYVADNDGRPQAMWIARRALDKPTDPGLLDNLIGGGVPEGQSPLETVLREGWEEAGLTPREMLDLEPGHVLQLARDIPEGFQREHLSVFDLALPAATTPVNQDGEVAELTLMPIAEALALAATDAMTVDAGLVTLDFALRHRLLPAETHAALEAALAPLRIGPTMLSD
ncbi:DUF4743 domain-containing protein [Aquincola sp. S2]|uniref:DUF4743 domain-containing protein n=1 Tax=Pseudaquabacterium terrae TaxID=2732868 RepID=A0ABX2EC65_9BURK|nr:DUF4743 domain-containing protein [Aquabacterium terrae]NRF66367.1 DUF4743 domain-containing protein [Aquabacterium terrae]